MRIVIVLVKMSIKLNKRLFFFLKVVRLEVEKLRKS